MAIYSKCHIISDTSFSMSIIITIEILHNRYQAVLKYSVQLTSESVNRS